MQVPLPLQKNSSSEVPERAGLGKKLAWEELGWTARNKEKRKKKGWLNITSADRELFKQKIAPKDCQDKRGNSWKQVDPIVADPIVQINNKRNIMQTYTEIPYQTAQKEGTELPNIQP